MKKSVVSVKLRRQYSSVIQATVLERTVTIKVEGKISDPSLLRDVDIRCFHILKKDERSYYPAINYSNDREWRAGKDVAAQL